MPSTTSQKQKVYTVSIPGGRFLVRPCDSEQGHFKAGLYFRTASNSVRIGEPLYVSPVLEGERRGVLLQLGSGSAQRTAFLASQTLLTGKPKGIAASCLAMGLRFDPLQIRRLLSYCGECYAAGMATTPSGAVTASRSLPAAPWTVQEVQ